MTVLVGNTVRHLRSQRLSRARDGKFLIVPLDHSFSDGPLCTAGQFSSLVSTICAAGADAIVVHKGRLRHIPLESCIDCSVIIHLSGSTSGGPDPDRKTLVGGVEEAVAAGADAVSVHLNMGAESEGEQLADLGAISRECERQGVPLLAMMYARGPNVADPADPQRIRHAVTVATDLGADLIKCNLPVPTDALAQVTSETPVPVLVAGGRRAAQENDDLVEFASTAMKCGAAGLAVGRRIFEHHDPGRVVADLQRTIHSASEGE